MPLAEYEFADWSLLPMRKSACVYKRPSPTHLTPTSPSEQRSAALSPRSSREFRLRQMAFMLQTCKLQISPITSDLAVSAY